MNQEEISTREAKARAAIRKSLGTPQGEYGADAFVSHHLEELDGAYWQQHCATRTPAPVRVLDILVLRSHWAEDDEEGLDVFDFSLPGEVTDYVISVSFDDAGEVDDISMES